MQYFPPTQVLSFFQTTFLYIQLIPFLVFLDRRQQTESVHTGIEQFLISQSISYTSVTISGSLLRLPKEEKFDVTLKVLQCDVFTVSPIKVSFFYWLIIIYEL